MKTKIILGLVVTFVTLTTCSLTAVASTYQYVNTAGAIQNVEADSASQALAMASNISPNSGVMLNMGLVLGAMTTTTSTLGNTGPTVPYMTYQYVNVSGQVQTIIASTSDQAFSIATNIAFNSGVMQVPANQAGI